MYGVIEKIIHFDNNVLRNTVGVNLNFNVFDDLSDDPADWAIAEVAADFSKCYSASELQYNAIDYVFDQSNWMKSRFGDGSFPVWYGSQELKTTFYETIYHWKQFLSDTPALLAEANGETLYSVRTVFNVSCQSSLIDLRNKQKKFPFLVAKDDYKNTRELGLKFSNEGIPGLIVTSARYSKGTNFAVFNQKVLKSASLQGNYLYKLSKDKKGEVAVTTLKSKKIVEVIK